jgi:hypothetical protein
MRRFASLCAVAACSIGFGGSAAAQFNGPSASAPLPVPPSAHGAPAYPYHATSQAMLSYDAGQGHIVQGHGAQGHNVQGHCAHGHGCSHCGAGSQPSKFWTTFYRNTRWPMPFRAQDVNAVTSFFEIQRENGWKLHNTVGHAYFDTHTQQLTDAGRNHIQSILSDNPMERRVVFVLQGMTPDQTARRVESAQLAISALVPTGELPPIYLTDRDSPGSSGAYQTAVTRAMMTSMPAPRLPSLNNGQGGGAPTP